MNPSLRSRSATRFSVACALALFVSPLIAALELDRIIAVVDEDVIMQSELDAQLRRVRSQLRQQGTPLPPTTVLERQVMERLVVQRIQLQMAERTGLVVSDEMLASTIANIAGQNNLSVAQFREILAQEGYNFNEFQEDIRKEIIISRLKQREVDNRVAVSDSEVDNFLGNQAAQGESDVEYQLLHILIATDGSGGNFASARLKAEDLLEQLRDGADFKRLALNYSDGQNSLEGGDLGWRKGAEIPSLFADTALQMEVGDVSDVITSPSGLHIIKLNDRRSGEKVLVEQTRARHILIRPSELITEEAARERLEQLTLRLQGGADFGDLARTHSDDRASALDGGSLGWVSPGQMVPQFEEVMNGTSVGATSRPFQTEFGWHILTVEERRTYDGTEEVRRSKARAAIRNRKAEDSFQT
ncbi:MAG: molecular chaperone SurA, partial [Gammaproteobacteria bacterium]|nr:molecular chaperone SurA [Gammaproteobacteria bacterium]